MKLPFITHYRRLLALVLLALLGSQVAHAADYYVSLSGNDNNNGTSAGQAWRTIAKALAAVNANQGHVIRLGAGTFTEPNILAVPSGVSLIGAGAGQTKILVNSYYTLTDYNQWRQATYHPERFVIQLNGANQTLKGFSLDGQVRRNVGGIYAQNAVNVVFDDLNIQNFRVSGLFLAEKSVNSEIKNSYFKNNAYADRVTGDTGNILFDFNKNLSIHDNYIEEQGAISSGFGGYGIKRAQGTPAGEAYTWGYEKENFHEGTKIFNNTIVVPEYGAWDNGKAPGIAIEIAGGMLKNVEIYNNKVNNHVSIVANFNEGLYRGLAVRIHHNFFNLGHGRYAYAIEANAPGMEIDHNIFEGGLNPIAQWDDRRDKNNFFDHSIHHNVWYDQWDDQALLHYNRLPSGGKGLQFYNNTVIANNRPSNIFYVGGDEAGEIKNNLFVSTNGAREDIFGLQLNGTTANNGFYNFPVRGTNAVTANPRLTLSGNHPTPFYELQAGSPAINAGVALAGITDGAVGAPDLGAFEYGVAPWQAGVPGTTVVTPPTQVAGVLEAGAVYQIETAVSPAGRTAVLSVAGAGTADGTQAQLVTATASNSQRWKAVDAGNGLYTFVPQHAPSKVLDIAGSGTADGTKVQLWTANGTGAQQFRLADAGNGTFTVQPSYTTASVLDVDNGNSADGTIVKLYTANNSNAQKWKFTKLVGASGIELNAEYRIETALAPGKVLSLAGGGTGDGTQAQIATATGATSQRWKAVDAGNGTFTFVPQHAPGSALDIAASGTADGTKVQLWTANGTGAQKFKVADAGNGYVTLQPSYSTTSVLDVDNGNTADGTTVKLYTANNSNAQKWKFIKFQTAGRAAAPAAEAVSATTGAALSVFPNPNLGVATVALAAQTAQTVTVMVMNKTGLVGLFTVPVKPGDNQFKLPVQLPADTYYVRANIDGQKYTFTLQVQ